MSINSFLNKLFAEYEQIAPGFALGIMYGSKLVLTKNHGMADIKKCILCSSSTNFRLASVTKQFTATCILQLIDKGEIKINDSLTKYFPQFIYAKSVSIYHLLTHTSGLLDYEDLIPSTRKRPISDKEVVNLIAKQKTSHFLPGTSRKYNNGNYCILKEIIEKVSKMPFKVYLRENIFKPLKMNNSVLSERGKNKIHSKAIGYSITSQGRIKETNNDITSYTTGDGSIYSNIEDLSKRILNKKKILSKEGLKVAENPLELTDEKDTFYGYGLNITSIHGYKVIYHGGYSIGFRTSILTIPKKKIGIIFLSNLNKNEGSDFTIKIAHYLLNKDLESL